MFEHGRDARQHIERHLAIGDRLTAAPRVVEADLQRQVLERCFKDNRVRPVAVANANQPMFAYADCVDQVANRQAHMVEHAVATGRPGLLTARVVRQCGIKKSPVAGRSQIFVQRKQQEQVEV